MTGARRQPREALVAAAFVLPSFIVFAVFKYYPLLFNFYLSFTSWDFFSRDKTFVGGSNFRLLLASPVFWQVLGNTLVYTFWSTAASVVGGFAVAAALRRRRGVAGMALKTLFFIPNITTASAVALLWVWMFDPEFGLAGQLFALFGRQSPRWLLTPGYAMAVVVSLSVWRSIGYVMLIYLAGMAGISEEYYDAARIDGASRSQRLFRITIPMLKLTTFFLVVTSFISAMQVFDIVSVMTGGGPYNTTMVMNLYIYQTAFVKAKAGYASALSVVLFLLVLLCTIVQKRISDRGDDRA